MNEQNSASRAADGVCQRTPHDGLERDSTSAELRAPSCVSGSSLCVVALETCRER